MRIGFDAKRAFLNHSGLGNYSRQTILLLQQYFPENAYVLFTPKQRKTLSFISDNNTGISIVTPKFQQLAFMRSLWRTFWLSKVASKYDLDVFHGLSHELPHGINNTTIKTVVTFHDLIYLRFPQLYSRIDRTLYDKKFKYSSQIADHIIAVSEQTKSDLISYYHTEAEKITVVYQGCNPLFYNSVSDEQKSILRQKYGLPSQFMLSVGTIEARKNLMLAVEAMQKLKNDIPLVAIGRATPYLDKMRDFAGKNGLSKRLIVLHGIPSEELPVFYQTADIFVYPSIFEGFGIPILEALASNTPVISSTGSCFAETGGKSSIYVNPYDSSELASAIDKVLNDTALQSKMKKDGWQHAQNFTGEKIAGDLMRVYREVLNQ